MASIGTSLELRNQVPPPGPPPLQSSLGRKYHKDNGDIGRWTQRALNKNKGMKTQAYGNGSIFCCFLTLKGYPPPMLHNGSIYSPQMGNGGYN